MSIRYAGYTGTTVRVPSRLRARYNAHCAVCRDPAPFDTLTERDQWVADHPHRVLTSTEYRP